MTTQDLIDYANNHYDYETEHPDAADAYENVLASIATNGESEQILDAIDHMNEDVAFEFRTESPYMGQDRKPFDTATSVIAYLYLGQEEMEIQLPREVADEDEARALDKEGYACTVGSDLVYTPYPDNLFVVAVKR